MALAHTVAFYTDHGRTLLQRLTRHGRRRCDRIPYIPGQVSPPSLTVPEQPPGARIADSALAVRPSPARQSSAVWSDLRGFRSGPVVSGKRPEFELCSLNMLHGFCSGILPGLPRSVEVEVLRVEPFR